ncbi:MAG: tripartite tricarboxylate transporter TctB family protein [Treponemataceae bacterium]
MRKDLINGVLTIALSVFIFFYAATFSKGGFSFAENPSLYPRMLAGILFLLGSSLVFQTLLKRKRAVNKKAATTPPEEKTGPEPEGKTRVLKIAAALIGFVVITWIVGFIIAALLFCFLAPLILGTTKKTAIIVSLSLTVVISVLFFLFFKVPVPHGILIG